MDREVLLKVYDSARFMAEDHERIESELQIRAAYDFSPLPNTILLFAVVYGLMTIGLVALLVTAELGVLEAGEGLMMGV